MPVDVAREPGSGKLKTPCERMHLANSTAPLEDWPPLAGALAAVVLVVARLATPALGKPPPQAAAARARQ